MLPGSVLCHPLCGASWEGYCIEQILNRLPKGATASHYRTHAGAEVDLVIEQPDGKISAVEIKRTLSPKVTPGLICPHGSGTFRLSRARSEAALHRARQAPPTTSRKMWFSCYSGLPWL